MALGPVLSSDRCLNAIDDGGIKLRTCIYDPLTLTRACRQPEVWGYWRVELQQPWETRPVGQTPKAGLFPWGVNVVMWWHPWYICTSCLHHDCLSFWRQTSHRNSTSHIAWIHYRLSLRQRRFIAPRQPRILLIMYRDSMVSLLNVVEDNCTLKWMSEAGNVSAH